LCKNKQAKQSACNELQKNYEYKYGYGGKEIIKLKIKNVRSVRVYYNNKQVTFDGCFETNFQIYLFTGIEKKND